MLGLGDPIEDRATRDEAMTSGTVRRTWLGRPLQLKRRLANRFQPDLGLDAAHRSRESEPLLGARQPDVACPDQELNGPRRCCSTRGRRGGGQPVVQVVDRAGGELHDGRLRRCRRWELHPLAQPDLRLPGSSFFI